MNGSDEAKAASSLAPTIGTPEMGLRTASIKCRIGSQLLEQRPVDDGADFAQRIERLGHARAT